MTDAILANEAIDAAVLPRAEDLAYQSLDARHATILMTEWLLVLLVPSTAWIVLNALGIIEPTFFSGFRYLLLPLLPVPLIIVFSRLYAQRCGYALRDLDIHYRQGIIWRKETSLPLNRIQHVEIERNPLERFFGLSTLKFFAAGGGSADLKIPALKDSDANQLRAFVLAQAGADHDDA